MSRMIRKPKEDDEDPAVLEAEIARLQRQYRVLDGDRRAYADEAQLTLKKQVCSKWYVCVCVCDKRRNALQQTTTSRCLCF
jgi:hypothetical protein